MKLKDNQRQPETTKDQKEYLNIYIHLLKCYNIKIKLAKLAKGKAFWMNQSMNGVKFEVCIENDEEK